MEIKGSYSKKNPIKKQKGPTINSEEEKRINKNDKTNKELTLAHQLILIYLSSIILFLESIFILLLSLKKGFLKKQILSYNTNLGFDIIIKNSNSKNRRF